jgi:hypothetical protein
MPQLNLVVPKDARRELAQVALILGISESDVLDRGFRIIKEALKIDAEILFKIKDNSAIKVKYR